MEEVQDDYDEVREQQEAEWSNERNEEYLEDLERHGE